MPEQPKSKSFWKSKTFWLNVAVIGAEVMGVMPLPPGAATVALGTANVVLRKFTTDPVHIVAPKE